MLARGSWRLGVSGGIERSWRAACHATVSGRPDRESSGRRLSAGFLPQGLCAGLPAADKALVKAAAHSVVCVDDYDLSTSISHW